jgi:hypothetical protein
MDRSGDVERTRTAAQDPQRRPFDQAENREVELGLRRGRDLVVEGLDVGL